ncbi:MAG: hypothetical protein ABI281_01095 [Caldimonas sp.]
MRRPLRLIAFAALSTSATAAPGPGRYDAQLCVATRATAAPSCGAARVELRDGGRVEVRVADITYRLVLRSSQLDVLTLHGSMRIDEFSADYAWVGDVLRFGDAAKGVVYEVRLQGLHAGR